MDFSPSARLGLGLIPASKRGFPLLHFIKAYFCAFRVEFRPLSPNLEASDFTTAGLLLIPRSDCVCKKIVNRLVKRIKRGKLSLSLCRPP